MIYEWKLTFSVERNGGQANAIKFFFSLSTPPPSFFSFSFVIKKPVKQMIVGRSVSLIVTADFRSE